MADLGKLEDQCLISLQEGNVYKVKKILDTFPSLIENVWQMVYRQGCLYTVAYFINTYNVEISCRVVYDAILSSNVEVLALYVEEGFSFQKPLVHGTGEPEEFDVKYPAVAYFKVMAGCARPLPMITLLLSKQDLKHLPVKLQKDLLEHACTYSTLPVVRYFVEHLQLTPETWDYAFLSNAMLMTLIFEQEDIFLYLFNLSQKDLSPRKRQSFLTEAISSGCEGVVKFLVKFGVDIERMSREDLRGLLSMDIDFIFSLAKISPEKTELIFSLAIELGDLDLITHFLIKKTPLPDIVVPGEGLDFLWLSIDQPGFLQRFNSNGI